MVRLALAALTATALSACTSRPAALPSYELTLRKVESYIDAVGPGSGKVTDRGAAYRCVDPSSGTQPQIYRVVSFDGSDAAGAQGYVVAVKQSLTAQGWQGSPGGHFTQTIDGVPAWLSIVEDGTQVRISGTVGLDACLLER